MELDSFSALVELNLYRGDPILGYRHSLLDCDFYDCFRCYPEAALDFYSKNGLDVETFWNGFHKIYGDGDPSIFKELENIIVSKTLTYRVDSINEVSSKYLRRFSGGIFFLGKNNFTYYLSALISKCCSGEIENLGMAIDTMIFALHDMGKKASSSCIDSFIVEEYFFPVVANFLSCIYLYSPDEFFDAKKALDVFWCRYLFEVP